MLTPVLEKQIITKAKSKYINVGDKLCEYNEEFTLYMTTRLPNPHFSPEDQAKTTVVDFTVTQKGLEEQLLGKRDPEGAALARGAAQPGARGGHVNTKSLLRSTSCCSSASARTRATCSTTRSSSACSPTPRRRRPR